MDRFLLHLLLLQYSRLLLPLLLYLLLSCSTPPRLVHFFKVPRHVYDPGNALIVRPFLHHPRLLLQPTGQQCDPVAIVAPNTTRSLPRLTTIKVTHPLFPTIYILFSLDSSLLLPTNTRSHRFFFVFALLLRGSCTYRTFSKKKKKRKRIR